MTVSQLRDRMTEKVVPEKLMPQNIVEFLMDEDAELPELDAFTFLNRLRALGIGSADFLYLLSGCGAPAEAVEKVRKNPAMNLQGLILTLDGAGLTSQDYTRMLYTARQLWERTLTMRLEDEEQNEPAPVLAEEAYEPADDIREYPEETDETEDINDYPEETENIIEYPEEAEDTDDHPAETEDVAEYPAEDEITEEPAEADEIPASEEQAEPSEEMIGQEEPPVEEPETLNLPELPEEAEESADHEELPEDTAEEPAEDEPISEETSEFRPIDMDELRRNLIADAEELSDEEDETTPDENADAEEDDSEEIPSQYHRGALITSVIGAAAVFATAACVGFMGFAPAETVSTRFAADSDEIFAAIYRSYNDGVIGADAAQWSGEVSAFGDMLVKSDGSLGTFYSGGVLYTAGPTGISCENADGAQLSAADVITPPEDTEFVYAQLGGDAVYAVFSGAECGFVRIDGGKVTYTAEQDGVLTDFVFEEDAVRVGSVYTPPFSESFSSSQTECFLPSLGTGEKKLLAPENVLLSGVSGCSYAISAEYSLADGAAENAYAALGCPVYASADGFAAMTDGDNGLFIRIENTADGLSHTAVRTDKFTSAAGGNGVYAAVGSDESGSVVTIYNSGFTPAAALKNFDREVTSLRRSGNIIYISGADGVFMAVDCTDAANPAVISEVKSGRILGESAITAENTSDGLTFRVYSADGEVCSYTKKVDGDAAATLAAGSENAFFAGDGVYGAAYSWFDGVSVVSEYAVFGSHKEEVTLFDDKTGFTSAFEHGGTLCLVYGGGKISSDIHI